MLYKNSFLLYGKIYITTAQFTTAVHVQLYLKYLCTNEFAPSVISPNSVIVKFSRLPFRYSQPDSRRPLPWLFHLHPSSKVVRIRSKANFLYQGWAKAILPPSGYRMSEYTAVKRLTRKLDHYGVRGTPRTVAVC